MRLQVLAKKKKAYDETFHYGLNIIRGDNGGGKSTIADLIFYVLGGNASGFKPEALTCDTVYAEFEINKAPLVIRRVIDPKFRAGMMFFWGRLDDALKAGPEEWRQYSGTRSANAESYSEVLFRELGIPEVKEETGANITFYQLLRLLYVDQLSSLQSLLRDEDNFDAAPIRSATYDVLIGTYNDDLYSDIFALRNAERQYSEAKAQSQGIKKFLRQSKIIADAPTLQKAQVRLRESLTVVEAKIAKASDTTPRASKTADTKAIDDLRSKLRVSKVAYDATIEQRDRAELELTDSRLFINELKKRLQEIEESVAIHTAFGDLPISHCPCCLSTIKNPVDSDTCPLCRQGLAESTRHSHIIRMKHDLAQQLRESSELIEDKEQHLQASHVEVARQGALLSSAQQALNTAVNESRSQRESVVDLLFTEKGRILAEIEHIARQSEIIATLEQLEARLTELAAVVSRLTTSIETAKRELSQKQAKASLKIQELALELLSSDQVREPFFGTAQSVEIDPAKNTFSLNGRNNFSASSIVYLKNCIHFSIFFASLELDFFRYPRFILCDNMEDKGMQLERSRNLQRKVAEMSDASDVVHQIIFTTSMIDPSLNNSRYCVGKFCTPGDWSLSL